MQRYALDERSELAKTLRSAGPAAPTLCAGWTTERLAAHLLLRERSLVEAAGRLPVARLKDRADKAMAELCAERSYQQLVDDFERGPTWPSPAVVWSFPPVRESINLLEYVVHHEDVRRAVEPWVPRPLSVARQRAVWSRLKFVTAMTLRTLPVGVELRWPPHGTIVTRRAKHGYPTVTVTGEPVELAMLAFGRQRAVRVDYDGSPSAVAELREARIGV